MEIMHDMTGSRRQKQMGPFCSRAAGRNRVTGTSAQLDSATGHRRAALAIPVATAQKTTRIRVRSTAENRDWGWAFLLLEGRDPK